MPLPQVIDRCSASIKVANTGILPLVVNLKPSARTTRTWPRANNMADNPRAIGCPSSEQYAALFSRNERRGIAHNTAPEARGYY